MIRPCHECSDPSQSAGSHTVVITEEEKRNAVESIPSTFVYPETALSQPSQGFTKAIRTNVQNMQHFIHH